MAVETIVARIAEDADAEIASLIGEADARAAALWLSERPGDGSAPVSDTVAYLAVGTGVSAGVAAASAAELR